MALGVGCTPSSQSTTTLSWSSTMAVDLQMSLTAALPAKMSAGLFWHWQLKPDTLTSRVFCATSVSVLMTLCAWCLVHLPHKDTPFGTVEERCLTRVC